MTALPSSPVGDDRIRYFLFINGRWRWRPTKAMRARGFALVNMGRSPVASAEDKARAVKLNAEWDKIRSGLTTTSAKVYPPRSVGEGYERAMNLRSAERKAKGVLWTKEQESRDDWPRAWKWLEPLFGDVDPTTVQPEHFIDIDKKTGKPIGLIPTVEAKVSATERHRVVKVWRALWKRMAAMDYCKKDADPTLTFANSAPAPRQEVWAHRDVLRLVQRAWRLEFYGLAAVMAVAWDSILSPIDTRKLTPGQAGQDDEGVFFFLDRAKTGRAAAGTLTQWSEAVLCAYIATLPFDLHADAPIFRNRSGAPYTKDTLGDDFRTVRTDLFGPDEDRQLADMRRSGAREADAGGTTDADLSNKMANTIHASSRLRKTYTPVNLVSVRRVDGARLLGRERLAEQKPDGSVTVLFGRVSQRGGKTELP